jgi:quercetin dioxygenase-like cupin family protein
MYFFDLNSQSFRKKRDKVYIKSITGVNSQLCIIRLESGEKTEHSHNNEQIGYILSGEVVITIAGIKRELRSGEGYFIPGNILHSFEVLGESVEYIEFFSPPKEDNI